MPVMSDICRLDRAHLEQIDNQGRCMITDHGAFVLFNVYGPAVTNEEAERFAMKLTLYEVMFISLLAATSTAL